MIDAEMRNGRIGAGERASRGSESDVIHDPYEQERTSSAAVRLYGFVGMRWTHVRGFSLPMTIPAC